MIRELAHPCWVVECDTCGEQIATVDGCETVHYRDQVDAAANDMLCHRCEEAAS